MRNKRQLAAAFVVASFLSVGMPLYASEGIQSERSMCFFIVGLGEKGVPSFVVGSLLQLFGCEAV
jgi:hypothetical protein